MKFVLNLLSLIFFILIGISCQKDMTEQVCNGSPVLKKIQFSLYTEKDFSDYDNNITFTLAIRNATNHIVWDSILSPMKIKDIPGIKDKLVIKKTITDDECALLKVGFIYAIENVGISWYWTNTKPGETFKKVEFNFQ